MLLVRRKL